MGRGGGQMVRVLAFYSDNPSSNPSEDFKFSIKCVFEKNKNKQKEAWVGSFKNSFVFFSNTLFGLYIKMT